MDVSFLAYCARACVAAVFLFSAMWKLRNGRLFRVALIGAMPIVLRRLEPVVVATVIPVEIAIGVSLLAPSAIGQVAALAAVALIVVFTASLLWRSDLSSGCGCWRLSGEPPTKRMLFARNALLVAMATVGVVAAGPSISALSVFAGMIGLVVGLLIMELPEVAQIATLEERSRIVR